VLLLRWVWVVCADTVVVTTTTVVVLVAVMVGVDEVVKVVVVLVDVGTNGANASGFTVIAAMAILPERCASLPTMPTTDLINSSRREEE